MVALGTTVAVQDSSTPGTAVKNSRPTPAGTGPGHSRPIFSAGGRESSPTHCRIRSGVQWASAAARSAALTRVTTRSSAALAGAATTTSAVATATATSEAATRERGLVIMNRRRADRR
ncbi:hypothetical protein Amsp01_059350 [Amycolatopsis sp. NBRC 101858]|nr:hypothetical protein Amsp01_059350 [Amycolatopsis sp. NBRC 101858]